MTVKKLKQILEFYDDEMGVVIRYNDPGSDEPLYLGFSESDIEEDTFWDYDEEKESENSVIIEI